MFIRIYTNHKDTKNTKKSLKKCNHLEDSKHFETLQQIKEWNGCEGEIRSILKSVVVSDII